MVWDVNWDAIKVQASMWTTVEAATVLITLLCIWVLMKIMEIVLKYPLKMAESALHFLADVFPYKMRIAFTRCTFFIILFAFFYRDDDLRSFELNSLRSLFASNKQRN